MRPFLTVILACGPLAILVAPGCGSSPPADESGGGGDEGDTGGTGAGGARHGTGGRGAGGAVTGAGGTVTGAGGTVTGAGGAVTGTGGDPGGGGAGGGDSPGDAGPDDTGGMPGAGGGTGAPPLGGNFGGLGPGSPDDAPPLVLPGSHLMFDGKTLMGWNCDGKWSVKDGAIDATGSGNSFCKSTDQHDTFRLTGKSRIVVNPSDHAGICFWPIGNAFLQLTPVSGSLWDYRGGGGVRTLPRIFDYTKWNFFELLVDAKTGNVDLAVNGHVFPTYVDKKAHNKGAIALQLHAQPNEVQYKDLAVDDAPAVMKLLTVIPGK